MASHSVNNLVNHLVSHLVNHSQLVTGTFTMVLSGFIQPLIGFITMVISEPQPQVHNQVDLLVISIIIPLFLVIVGSPHCWFLPAALVIESVNYILSYSIIVRCRCIYLYVRIIAVLLVTSYTRSILAHIVEPLVAIACIYCIYIYHIWFSSLAIIGY